MTAGELCDYCTRRPGETSDGRPLGPTYGGDTADVCGRPARAWLSESPARLYNRCDDHAPLGGTLA